MEKRRTTGDCRDGQGETILLVEDNATILEMARTVLERLEYRMLTAKSPSEALRMAGDQACGVDLLLTDAIMPEMNGKELSHRLLAL